MDLVDDSPSRSSASTLIRRRKLKINVQNLDAHDSRDEGLILDEQDDAVEPELSSFYEVSTSPHTPTSSRCEVAFKPLSRRKLIEKDGPKIESENLARNRQMLQSGNFFQFFWFELTRGYALENDEARYAEKRRKVYAFIKIPKELEKFLFYGYLQCLDAFLYVFTFLPLRFFMAIWGILIKLALFLGGKRSSKRNVTTPGEACDILKVLIILIASFLMTFIDTSVIYHVVRGQAVIKLYIFFNMLEVADKLFSSFGQDILDALFWTATEPKGKRNANYFGTLTHLFMAILYVWLHTVLVLLQATTLNVAFNSHSKALLTIMISNNFVELKGNVFKKFAKNNLFQMACSDVRERFHYFVLLAIVIIRNMTAVDWKTEHFVEMVPDLLLVAFGEIMVDWFKHAFITKFNEIPFEVYKDFKITLAYDVVKSRDVAAFSDHSDQVARRMGFIPLPLSVLVIRIFTQSFSCNKSIQIGLWSLAFIAVLLFKIANSIFVLGKAAQYISHYEELQQRGAHLLKRMSKKRSKSVPSSPRLGLIEFGDVMQLNHPGNGFTASDLLAAQQVAALETLEASLRENPTLSAKRRSKSVNYLVKMEERLRQNSAGGAGGENSVGRASTPSSNIATATGGGAISSDIIATDSTSTPTVAPPSDAAVLMTSATPTTAEMQALLGVDRYTLVNGDRIEP